MTTDAVMNAVCRVFPVTPDDIKGTRRRRHEAEARHLFCHILYAYLRMSNAAIGEAANRDRTAVIYGRKTFQKIYDTDRHYRALADQVIASLGLTSLAA